MTHQQISHYKTGKSNIKYSRFEEIRAYLESFPSPDLEEEQTRYDASVRQDNVIVSKLRSIKTDIGAIDARLDELIRDTLGN